MSDTALATLITVVVLAAMFAWPPLLTVFCPPCNRALQRLRARRARPEAQAATVSEREAA